MRACTYGVLRPDGRPVVRGQRALLACCLTLVAVLAAMLGTPVCALAAEAEAKLVVSQEYSSDSTGVDKTFTYVLEAVTPGAPLPVGGSDGVFAFTMTKDDEYTLLVPFESPLDQEYEYRLYQKVDQKKEGFTYDDTVYTVRLLFAGFDENYGVLIAYDNDGLKPNKVSWSVTYVTPPVPPAPPEPAPTPGRVPKTSDVLTSPVVVSGITSGALALIAMGALLRTKMRGDER